MRLSSEPDELIGEHKMRRWHVIPPTRFLAIYLHEHVADDPRTMHDHPASNISVLLAGELVEYTPDLPVDPGFFDCVTYNGRTVYFSRATGRTIEKSRFVPRVCFRLAEDPHRLELPAPGARAWTLWIRFRNRRQWGFFEPAGWRPRRRSAAL